MKCITCDIDNCYKCTIGPFSGMRLKENPVNGISFNDDIDAIQRATVSSSIGGMQIKVQARINRGKMVFDQAGTFILKPRPQGEYAFRNDVPYNEHVTMRIAKKIFNLDVAMNGIVIIDEQPVYITRHFDITENGRVGMENFLQLMKMSEATHGRNYKYESTYQEMGDVIDQHFLGPVIQKMKLFKRVLFNYLIGNGDAHLGNFSGLMTPMGNHKLSPIYDVLNTTMHTPNESRTAIPLFEDHDSEFFLANGFYGHQCFQDLGRSYGLPERLTLGLINDIVNRDKIDKAIEYLEQSALSEDAKQAYVNLVNDRYDVLTR